MVRSDGRTAYDLRPVKITPGHLLFAEGSALIEAGSTRVLCAVSVEERIPAFLRGMGRGWISAEYGMLPRSTPTRTARDGGQGRERGRVYEIQRLIGRALRAVTRLDALGERTFIVDCDVLQADGGTRTAAVTGSYVALYQAFSNLKRQGLLKTIPFHNAVAAISVGLLDGVPLLDLSYEEDSHADVDFNCVMTDQGDLVEVQGTAESQPFARQSLDALLDLAHTGIQRLFAVQKTAIISL
ncbi:MAG: ribonuclease PH [Chloroflexi bacterium]|nr:ribonuclease PH [Chloroflexota bacterium]